MNHTLKGIVGLCLVIVTGLLGCCHGSRGSAQPKLQVAAFECDVTPPAGHPLCGGWIKPLSAVDDPLLAKGIVLSDGKTRYVLCAVDWCLLQTAAYDLFRSRIAQAANIPESQVSVHTVHQHNAPIADSKAELLLQQTAAPPPHLDLQFMETVTERLATAVKAACLQMRPVTAVGFGKAEVRQFASNRRVRLADGKIYSRSSFTSNKVMQAAAEGLIDPWLRTITLLDGPQPLVRLHFYASHPQGFYGDGRATSDTVGLARRRLEKEEAVPQIYFTGCAGNITAGKYNDGSPSSRAALTERIYTAMQQAIGATEFAPVDGHPPTTSKTETRAGLGLTWKTTTLKFEPRKEVEWSEPKLRQLMASTNASAADRIKSALSLAWAARLKQKSAVDLRSLALGPVTILLLPGEAFIEYQLYAHSLRPRDFLAVAAYGESGPGYVCLDASAKEGGYEPTMSRVGPPSEFRLKNAIATLLVSKKAQAIPLAYPDKLHLLSWRDEQGREHPIARASDWSKRRAHILQSMQQVMGPLPASAKPTTLDMQVLEKVEEPEFTRLKITYAAEPGERVPAYLLIPRKLEGKTPAMLCLHQTAVGGKAEPVGLGGKTNLFYARELAQRGYVTLAPDYPNFGDYRLDAYQRGYLSATMKGIWNHIRAVDLLQTLPQVDAKRIGVIGHSLGGHNALFVAAFDPRIKAVITSCGFNSFIKYYGGNLAGWSHSGYMPRIATEYANDPKKMPFDFTEVLAAVAPRPVFINAPLEDSNFEVSGVYDCLAAATPIYELLAAKDNLKASHPRCGHDFPPEVRDAAYQWLARWMAAGL